MAGGGSDRSARANRTTTGTGGGDADSERWWAVRRRLNKDRHQLAAVAATLYPDVPRIDGTELLCRDQWLPSPPTALSQVQLRWTDPPPAPAVTGSSAASAHVRPITAEGEHYRAYADAIAALDPPALFENRPSYRILAADLADADQHLDLARGHYFDAVSVAEALAHELAAAWSADSGAISIDQLPFRAAVGDPCDLARRPAGLAVTTLTLRRERPGTATFLLHWRDPAKVTHAGGMYQVMPVGVFQPADDAPGSIRNDLSIWRAMVREFSEELLGETEDYSRLGSPVRYSQWDFYRRLTAACQAGRLTTWLLGLGVDPLSLVTDVLAAVVFDADVFDAEFGRLVDVNSEGRVVQNDGAAGFPFTQAVIDRFAGGAEPMQAAGAATLRLAWQHRAALLD